MSLSLNLTQSLSVHPNLILSMRILQMNTLELTEYLKDIALENPLIDLDSAMPAEQDDALRVFSERRTLRQDEENRGFEPYDGTVPPGQAEEYDLLSSLRLQLWFLHLPPDVERTALLAAELLTPDGFLVETADSLAALAGVSLKTADAAVAALKSLEPAGIGASGFSECFKLQLDRIQPRPDLAYRMIEDCLDDFAANRLDKIAKACGVALSQVDTAAECIRALNPRPSCGLQSRDQTVYVVPDVFLTVGGAGLVLTMNDSRFPEIRMDSGYAALMYKTAEPELKSYFQKKERQLNLIEKSVAQRKKTVLSVACAIVQRQLAFFEGAAETILPLSLSDVAAETGFHASTVCRAVNGKYLQFAGGVLPLSSFFARSLVSGQSVDAVKQAIRSMIAGEDPRAPASDQAIADVLHGEGILLSRRTVAKYREELGIASSSGRRRRAPHPS